MNSFLKQTAETIVQQIGWEQLSHTTLVLPTHRAGVQLKDELLVLQQKVEQKAIYAPQITTIDQLFDSLSPLYSEDELATVVRLYRLYRNSQITDSQNPAGSSDIMPLDMFYGWGRQMIADFTNVDASMPAEEVPNFFENVIAATELEQLQIDDELRTRLVQLFGTKEYNIPDSVRSQYEQIWKRLFVLYRELHAEMASEQKGYPGMRQRSVMEQWNGVIKEKIQGRRFVFVGFNYLLPVEFELMKRLKEAGQAMFCWDYVANFQTNEKAFSFAIQNSGKLGSAVAPQQWSKAKEIDVYACSLREAQAQYVHQWLMDNYTAEGERVGIVICDETMLEPVIYALPSITLPGHDKPEPMNITKGFPLRNTQIAANAVRWLSDRNNGKGEDIVSPEFIDHLSEYLFPMSDETESSKEEEKAEVSEGLEWQELLQLESNYQMHKIINQIRKLVSDGLGDIPVTLKLIRLLMRRMIENCSMPFHGEPICDIQVQGVLETRTLDFDKLLLLNVEEGVVPQSKSDISFIPYYLRKYYHMQTNDERATVYAYNFFRLLSRAGQVTMLFSHIGGVDNSKGMSRFIMQMLASPEFNIHKYRLVESSKLNTTSLIETDKKSLVESLGLTTDTSGHLVQTKDGKTKIYHLSPSSLNTYIACPLAFYLDKIKEIKEPETEETTLAANTFGSLVHNTMQAIYMQLGCNNKEQVEIQAEALEAYTSDEKLDEMLAEAYQMLNNDQQKYGRTTMYTMEKYFMDNPKIKQYVHHLINNDLQTIRREGLKIWMLEQSFYIDLPVPSIGTIQIGGKIDRVDVCGHLNGNERIRIIDYKTGGYTSTKLSAKLEDLMENRDKGYVRQTIIYSYVLAEALSKQGEKLMPIQPNLFFCSSDMSGNETVIKVDEPVNDFQTNLGDKILEPLQQKVAQLFTDSQFTPCEEGKCPAYCSFFDICKRKKPDF